jgi:hypothetical protein
MTVLRVLITMKVMMVEQDSVANTATHYGVDGRGSNPGGGAPLQTVPGNHPASYKVGNMSFSTGLKWPGRSIDSLPHLT